MAAVFDSRHYSRPGADPGSGIPGQSLAGFPRTLALRGDLCPKPSGCGRVVPVSRRSRACREPGPGDAHRAGRHLHAEARWHALPEHQGGNEVGPGRPSGSSSRTTLGPPVSWVAPRRPDSLGARSSSCGTLVRTPQRRTGGLPDLVLLLAGLGKAGRPQLIWRTPAGRVSCHARQKFVP